jgi:hypothetical protein
MVFGVTMVKYFFMSFGVLLVIVAFIGIMKKMQKKNGFMICDGVLVDYRINKMIAPQRCFPLVEYDVRGKKLTVALDVGYRGRKYKVGKKYLMHVNPANVSEAYEAGLGYYRLWLWIMVAGFWNVIIGLVALAK